MRLEELNGIEITTCQNHKEYVIEITEKSLILRNKNDTYVIDFDGRTDDEVMLQIFSFMKNCW